MVVMAVMVLCITEVLALDKDNFKKYATPLDLSKNTTSKQCELQHKLFLTSVENGDKWALQSEYYIIHK